ncbi:hypothetical protein SBF1_90030 [Candidatus Desulfosporosinus infrequens]|uniref:Uncharacterized protein n=1 Tax=Candidatus Desulfosporosinus infrequens TaxID=2043169 RepID=A0A2U3LWY3_9FIRM|nr:hypothetical protein SBF1_90030 [Candidatus Desulfosporosinus infrequens]
MEMERDELKGWIEELDPVIDPMVQEMSQLKADIKKYQRRVAFLEGLPDADRYPELRNDYVMKGNEYQQRLDMLLQTYTKLFNVREHVLIKLSNI